MVINSLTKIIQEYHHISTNPLWTFPLWDGPYLVNPWVLTAWIQLVTWGPCLCSDSFDLWTFLCRSPMGGNGTFTNKVLLVPHDFKDDFNDYSIYTIYYISLPKGYTIYLFPKVWCESNSVIPNPQGWVEITEAEFLVAVLHSLRLGRTFVACWHTPASTSRTSIQPATQKYILRTFPQSLDLVEMKMMKLFLMSRLTRLSCHVVIFWFVRRPYPKSFFQRASPAQVIGQNMNREELANVHGCQESFCRVNYNDLTLRPHWNDGWSGE